MKTASSLMLFVLLSSFAFAQSSDDSLGIPLDSLPGAMDSFSVEDTTQLMQALDSLTGSKSLDVNAILNVGRSDLSAGRIADALAQFDQAVQAAPGDAEAWGLKGKSLAELGRNAEALPSLDKAIELDPAFASARFDRARVHNLMGDPEAALEDLQSALSSDPTLKSLARHSKSFETLRSDERFKVLVK